VNLVTLAFNSGCRTVLEIGSGVSTAVWSNYVLRTGAEVYTVDGDLGSLQRYMEKSSLRGQISSTIRFREGTTITAQELIRFYNGPLEGISVPQGAHVFAENLEQFVVDNSPHQWKKMIHHFKEKRPDIARHVLQDDTVRLSPELVAFVSALQPQENELHLLKDAEQAGKAGVLDSFLAEGKVWDLIFFDSGEWSSMVEWVKFKGHIRVGGFAAFHDIFFPKSFKNFIVCASVLSDPDWRVIYVDQSTVQGLMVAQRLG
jgi:hypothetical protein